MSSVNEVCVCHAALPVPNYGNCTPVAVSNGPLIVPSTPYNLLLEDQLQYYSAMYVCTTESFVFELTSWARLPIEKLTVAQLVTNIPVYYETGGWGTR